MSSFVAAVSIALAWIVLRTRPNVRSRLASIQPARVSDPARPSAAACRRLVSRWRRNKTVAAGEAATVEMVFALSAELRAGRSPSHALMLVATHAGVLSEPLHVAAGAVAAGAAAGDELRCIADQPGCAGLRGVAAAWDVTASFGGPVADVLDRLGDVLDAERHARDALGAAMAGSRATMLLLATLPVFGLLLGQALGAHPVQMLLHRALGWLLLFAAGVLDVAGVLWTNVIIRRALR